MAQAKPAARSRTFKVLGEGSFATVFRVRDGSGFLALKLFLNEHQYLAEKQIVDSIAKHSKVSQHLIKYLGIREKIPRPNPRRVPKVPPMMNALLFEWAPYGSVAKFIKECRPLLTEDVLCHWTRHVAAALHFLASNNYILMDLKPENILVRADKTLAVADFGAAMETNTAVDLTTHRGTLIYSAPESLSKVGVTPAADVFSLGLCIYEWATGKLLTAAETKEETCLDEIDLAEVILQRIRGWPATPALPSPYSSAFNVLVQGMLYRFPTGRVTAAQIVVAQIIESTRKQALEIQLGLSGLEALTAQQAVTDKTTLLGQVAQLSQDLDLAEKGLKQCKGELEKERAGRKAEQGHLKSAMDDFQRAKEELLETRKEAQDAKEDARGVKAAYDQLQTSFEEATKQMVGPSGGGQDVISRDDYDREMHKASVECVESEKGRAKAEGDVNRLEQEVATLRAERDAANKKIESFFFRTVNDEIATLRAERDASQKKLEMGALRALQDELKIVRAERDALRQQAPAPLSTVPNSRKRMLPHEEQDLSIEMGNLSTSDDVAPEQVGH